MSHGAAAGQVRQKAAQRVALARAAELLGPDITADPAEVLVAAVRSSAALLGAAEAAVRADEPDPDALHQLAEAAMLAGRLSKLCLDAGVEQRLALQQEQAGELVGHLIRRTVESLDLPPEMQAAAFRHMRSELEVQKFALGPAGRLSVHELDAEISLVVERLDAAARADAVSGFPVKVAMAVDAALGAVSLSDADREKALAAVEAFLAADAAEQAKRDAARLERERAGLARSSAAWWVKPARSGNGSGNGGRW